MSKPILKWAATSQTSERPGRVSANVNNLAGGAMKRKPLDFQTHWQEIERVHTAEEQRQQDPVYQQHVSFEKQVSTSNRHVYAQTDRRRCRCCMFDDHDPFSSPIFLILSCLFACIYAQACACVCLSGASILAHAYSRVPNGCSANTQEYIN
jgi:hypothetical protein